MKQQAQQDQQPSFSQQPPVVVAFCYSCGHDCSNLAACEHCYRVPYDVQIQANQDPEHSPEVIFESRYATFYTTLKFCEVFETIFFANNRKFNNRL
jgi:hypothetical protein